MDTPITSRVYTQKHFVDLEKNAANTFPDFLDADVFIYAGAENVWKLHATVLQRASNIFMALLNEPDKNRKKKTKGSGTTVQMLMMVADHSNFEDPNFRSFKRIVRQLPLWI